MFLSSCVLPHDPGTWQCRDITHCKTLQLFRQIQSFRLQLSYDTTQFIQQKDNITPADEKTKYIVCLNDTLPLLTWRNSTDLYDDGKVIRFEMRGGRRTTEEMKTKEWKNGGDLYRDGDSSRAITFLPKALVQTKSYLFYSECERTVTSNLYFNAEADKEMFKHISSRNEIK